MASENTYYRYVALLSLLTTLNFFIWTLSWSGWSHIKIASDTCTANSFIVKMTEYILHNGQMKMADVFQSECWGHNPSSSNEENFKYTIQYLFEDCQHEAIIARTKGQVKYPILTLFTTWVGSTDKYFVHANTLKNWASFSDKIKPVLFTNNSELFEIATRYGWAVQPITVVAANGVPILKSMYQQAMQLYNTTFYAYCNGDILFEEGLVSTLIKVAQSFDMSEPLIIVGQRTNAEYVTTQESSSHDSIRNTALKRGKLFANNAEDYFVVTKSFPWSSVPNLVVGRRAYDNWLTAHAICWNITLIDATDSITGLHQTTGAGNMEGHTHPDGEYNVDLLKSLKSYGIVDFGFTTCSPWKTYISHCGNTEVVRRENLEQGCKCVHRD